MGSRTSKSNLILILGFIGIIAVLITIISDFILLAKPTNAITFLRMGTETMADIAPWRITIGTFLGVVALPFQILGLVPVYYGLKPSGKILPRIFVIITAHALLMGVAFHISYAYIGSGWRLYYDMENTNLIGNALIDKFDFYWNILFSIMMIEIIISSIIYISIIIKGKTLFSKWMAMLNPLIVLILVIPFIFLLPAPIGGYIAPAILNIVTLIFFCITFSIIYKVSK